VPSLQSVKTCLTKARAGKCHKRINRLGPQGSEAKKTSVVWCDLNLLDGVHTATVSDTATQATLLSIVCSYCDPTACVVTPGVNSRLHTFTAKSLGLSYWASKGWTQSTPLNCKYTLHLSCSGFYDPIITKSTCRNRRCSPKMGYLPVTKTHLCTLPILNRPLAHTHSPLGAYNTTCPSLPSPNNKKPRGPKYLTKNANETPQKTKPSPPNNPP
jgi:hypothetical protein